MAQAPAPKCNICKEDIAKVFCYECHHFLCQSCNSWHEKFPATKRHTVTDSQCVDRSTLMLTLVCEDHDLEFAYYCRDCECLICVQCVTSVHKGHSFTDIAEVAATARGDVKNRLEQIKDNIKNLSDLIDDFKTTKQTNLQTGTDNFITEINVVSKDLVRIIETETQTNLTDASDFLVQEKKQLLNNVAKLEKSCSEYSSLHERYEQILRDKLDVTFFLNQKSLAKEFESLDDISPPEEPKEIKPLKTDGFVDSVIERIENQFNLSYQRNAERKENHIKSTQNKSEKRQAVNLNLFGVQQITKINIVSVAIQIGKEESGYTFQMLHDFNDDPCKKSYDPLVKLPNSILLDSDRGFLAFGHDAEDQYYELVRRDSQQDCLFFKQFTKNIHKIQDGVTDIYKLKVKTFDQKKELTALALFSLLINFYVDHAECGITSSSKLYSTDIIWVLNVPAYWNSSVREILGHASKKKTILISDPEAVLLFWKYWSLNNRLDDKYSLYQPDSKYIVLNGRGDSIDLTCLKVEEDKSLTQLNRVMVSEYSELCKKFILSIVGNDVYSKFCTQYPEEEKDMLRDFESRYRQFSSACLRNAEKISLPLPGNFCQLCVKDLGKDFIDHTVYSNKIRWLSGMLRINTDLFLSLFDEVTTCVVNSVREMLKEPDVKDTSHIILTGRLMELSILCCRVRETFRDIKIIEFPFPDIVALKGAVILGHYPKVSCKRLFYRL
ncbi:heat shock 70 kDa protein 12A-like [Mytilus californianus]|uniref:heat shock 70 kDa protein 12A-like n=1 Tax=Mytilus californianus TaxID=6549 RepID=UPI00224786E6|nr:heat shock 70 kDa protein 12A-like [Mytilus californianus]